MRYPTLGTAAALAFATATAAAAQTLTSKEAEAVLFGTRGSTVAVSGALDATDQAIMKKTIDLLEQQINGPVKYYAAIAYSPDEGILTEALQSAMNYHSVASADAAAIAACNAVRGSGTAPCQVAARVLPRGYEARPLSLSYDASAAFSKAYRRAKSPKAFAISEVTGAYAIGTGPEAALAACQADRPGAGDCRVVVVD
ncbi:5-aminolevulic acid synthase [Palleronia sp. KMU-117]|uniref:5-aminolevulic acid synthase n=1 Tax=Palleronia sp. KMU-117 TaxID=3434108 RepID=UPI003D75D4FA